MKNKKNIYFITILLILSFSSFTYAEKSKSLWERLSEETTEIQKTELVYIDNTILHSYKNHLGTWNQIYNYSQAMFYSKKNNVAIEEIISINNITNNIWSGWVFVPYSSQIIEELNKQSNNRISIYLNKEKLLWPIAGSRITSHMGQRWGKNHSGIDIAAGVGTVVLAAQDGEVIESSFNVGGYGVSIIIKHQFGYVTRYAHLQSALVKPGTVVKKGQIIAYSGNTGHSTGPHLHFEVQANGIILNPESFLPSFDEITTLTSSQIKTVNKPY